MGCYAYCENCGCYMNEPTVREVLTNSYECKCGTINQPIKTTEDIIIDLVERVEKLENDK